MSIKFYEYNRCGTCQKASKFLINKEINFQSIPIRENPPTIAELQKMLEISGDIKKLLNTSGQDYRALNMKEQIKVLTSSEVLQMLNKNGNLIKRPFVIGEDVATTGFNEEEWNKLFKKSK